MGVRLPPRAFMILTTKDKIEYAALNLILLKSELESYMRGEWRHEYYWTIGYRKIYTGRKIFLNPDSVTDSTIVSGTVSEGSNPSQGATTTEEHIVCKQK